ncbi:hypothetical protein [Aquimarina sp. 2201CG5-10]|uniref:hypothetical protein n=1 Tax=Aquimarina callyspongiae TaxID=3098150 RepID=UPI002AB48844|nr:hypothetical protein [Aquimarina sp. 2201CG5-10]MDY8138812.1 hypothetical protein [Aquimarina sp. 2201CG5-10]
MDILEKERIVKKNIIEIFKEHFNNFSSDEEILNITPEREFDSNYIKYYESILDIFFIEQEHLGSITGKVKHTIKKVAELWNNTPHSFTPWEFQ